MVRLGEKPMNDSTLFTSKGTGTSPHRSIRKTEKVSPAPGKIIHNLTPKADKSSTQLSIEKTADIIIRGHNFGSIKHNSAKQERDDNSRSVVMVTESQFVFPG
jgi:hypothetical protein